MRNYPAQIDRELNEFAQAYGLHLNVVHQDSEVRSFQIVDDQALSYQLWLEPKSSGWVVHAWDFSARRSQHPATAQDIGEALEAAYRDVVTWIRELGHTRTPV